MRGSIYTDSTKAELLGTTIGNTVGTPYNVVCNPYLGGIPSIQTLPHCVMSLIGGEPIEFDFGIPADPNTEYYIEFSADFSSLVSSNKEARIKFSTSDIYEGQIYQNGSPLSSYDLKMGITEIGVYQAIGEGEEFRMTSTAYNNQNTSSGLANTLRIVAYKDIYEDANRVMVWEYEINETGLINLERNISGIISRTGGTEQPFNIFATMMLCNDTYCFEQITEEFTIQQFPSSNEDLQLGIDNYEAKMGYYPRGRIRLETTNSEAVVGVELTLIKITQLGSKTLTEIIEDEEYHYKKDYYKNLDFSCNSIGDCGFDFQFIDWVFGDASEYLWNVTTILATKETDYEDYLTNTFKTFITTAPAYSNIELTEQYARNQVCDAGMALLGSCWLGSPTPNYRNNEKTRWVLVVQDTTGNDIRDDLKISMQIQDCGFTYDCNSVYSEPDPESLLYSPSTSDFKQTTGENFFYFETLLIEDDGQLLENGHFYRMIATIEDTSGLHEYLVETTLEQVENLLFYDQEIKFYINNNYVCVDSPLKTCLPQLQCFACTAVPDESEIDQDITCVGVYTKSEIPIDYFETTIGNQYSDFSQDEANSQQYIQFDVSWDALVNQNIDETWETMTLSYPQLALDRTVGSLILYGIKFLGGNIPFNLAGEAVDAGFLIAWALDTNTLTGMRTDCNFNIPINSAMGSVGYDIHGIRILNQNDYPALEGVETSRLFEYANIEGIPLPQYTTTVDIYAGSYFVEKKTLSSRLVINETPATISDTNTGATLPNNIHFDLTEKMYYNNGTASMQSSIPLNYIIYLPPVSQTQNPFMDGDFWCWFFGTCPDIDDDGIGDGRTGGGTTVPEDPVGELSKLPAYTAEWIMNNIVWFIILLGLIMIGAFVIRAIKGAK